MAMHDLAREFKEPDVHKFAHSITARQFWWWVALYDMDRKDTRGLKSPEGFLAQLQQLKPSPSYGNLS